MKDKLRKRRDKTVLLERTEESSQCCDERATYNHSTGTLAQYKNTNPSLSYTMSTLEKAIEIAAIAHSGQKDKAGEHYILHPLKVMMCVTTAEERIVAVLHDVIEDSNFTLEDLRGCLKSFEGLNFTPTALP